VWPADLTWESFCSRHADVVPVHRILLAKRRQYAKELKTSVILTPNLTFSHVFPRDSYEQELVIDIVLRDDDRIEQLFGRLDKCQARIHQLDKRLSRLEKCIVLEPPFKPFKPHK
jgi:hypothetical protein